MKKIIWILITCLCLGGCGFGVDLPLTEKKHVFQAEIREVGYKNLLVEGLNNGMAGEYYVSFNVSQDLDEYEVNDIVEITFDGIVAESYPGQINGDGIKLIQKAQYELTIVNTEPVDGLIHYIVENKTNEDRYTWVPGFQILNDDGEWEDVDLIGGVCGNKDLLEDNRKSSIPVDAYNFKRNGLVRLRVPIYIKDNADLDKPDKILTSDEFNLDVGKPIHPFMIYEIHDDYFIAASTLDNFGCIVEMDLSSVINKITGEPYKMYDFMEILYDEKEVIQLEDNMIKIIPIEYYPYQEALYAKPAIYLYPESKMDVKVELDFDGKLTVAYPEYNNGWEVTAYPDGTLINHADGLEYTYLFWEGNGVNDFDLSEGFVVKGEESAKFLQDVLPQLGLTPREYNEMIVYWYPIMKENAYNLVSFQYEEYTEHARLNIEPEPDTVLRVYMVVKELNEPVEIKEQEIKSIERKGFSVVEWGGTLLP